MNNFRIVQSREFAPKPTKDCLELLLDKALENEIKALENEIKKSFDEELQRSIVRSSFHFREETKKAIRNEVDGSFVVRIVNKNTFPELAQRLLDYAAKLHLTVNPELSKVKVDEAILFGGRNNFDVNRVKDACEGFNGQMLPIYHLDRDFEIILDALRELASEKDELSLERGISLATGERAFVPTYNELKREKVGGKLVDKKRNEYFNIELDKEGKKLQRPAEHVRISTNFIKVGYDFIPINDNDSVYIYV
jgi:hypothetical protein